MHNDVSIKKARAIYYGLFASLFSFFENSGDLEKIQKTLEILSQNPLDDYSKNSLEHSLQMINTHGISHLQQEVNEVFFNPYTQFIPVTASYYLEDRDDGKKRLQMVEYLLSSKFRKDSENFHELEDHIGFIMLFMQKLLEANIEGDEKSSQISNDVFTNILNPFIDQFIFTLHEHPNSDFFKEIAILLRSFVAFERAFLNVAPTQEVVVDKDYTIRPKKRKPLTPRPKKNFEEMSLKDTY